MKNDEEPIQTGADSREEIVRLKAENERYASRIAQLELRISLQPQSGLPTHFRLEVELENLIANLDVRADTRGFSLLILQLSERYAAIWKTL